MTSVADGFAAESWTNVAFRPAYPVGDREEAERQVQLALNHPDDGAVCGKVPTRAYAPAPGSLAIVGRDANIARSRHQRHGALCV